MRRGTANIARVLAPRMWVTLITLDEECQPEINCRRRLSSGSWVGTSMHSPSPSQRPNRPAATSVVDN